MTIVIWLACIALAAFCLYIWAISGAVSKKYRLSTYYAHRGLHNANKPENTLPAFKAAVSCGFGIELDVRLSADKTVVVIHDDDLTRLADMPGKVEDYTADELSAMSILGSGYGIPTLKEVLKCVNKQVPLLIEIKSEGAAGKLEEEVYKILAPYDGEYAIQSFSPLSLRWFMKNSPQTVRGQLACGFSKGAEHISAFKKFFVKNLLTNFLCRPNFISYEYTGAGTGVVKRLRKSGLPIIVWTINRQEELNRVFFESDSVIFEGFTPREGNESTVI